MKTQLRPTLIARIIEQSARAGRRQYRGLILLLKPNQLEAPTGRDLRAAEVEE